eukprot:8292-Heterococcus_DN1.PRE.3
MKPATQVIILSTKSAPMLNPHDEAMNLNLTNSARTHEHQRLCAECCAAITSMMVCTETKCAANAVTIAWST